jgi:hypothetical protein
MKNYMRLITLVIHSILLSATLLIYEVSIAQSDKTISTISQLDTIGIRISLTEWNKMVADVVEQTNYADSSKRDTAYYIKYVRILNTIEKNNWFDKYTDVRKLFYDKVHSKALVVLDASGWKGGAYYCQALDLFMGGRRHANSIFYITDLK